MKKVPWQGILAVIGTILLLFWSGFMIDDYVNGKEAAADRPANPIEGMSHWVKDGEYGKGEHCCDKNYGHLEIFDGKEWVSIQENKDHYIQEEVWKIYCNDKWIPIDENEAIDCMTQTHAFRKEIQ